MTTAYGHDDDRREEGMAQEDIKRDSKIRRRRYASIQSVTIVPSFMDSFLFNSLVSTGNQKGIFHQKSIQKTICIQLKIT